MIEKIAQELKNKLKDFIPDTLIILGSGLGDLAEAISSPIFIDYNTIPQLPDIKISGHKGRFIAGKLGKHNILCMQGRFHLYEGHAPQLINHLISAIKTIGVTQMIVTNAAGSLRTDLLPGSIMLIEDHINFSGRNPLIGIDEEKYGPRFPAMNNAYDKDLRNLVQNTAQRHNIKLERGTYFMVLGPNFETPAEIKAFRILGGDAVGMSTVPEVIAAVHSGIKVLGFSVITNFGAGLCQTPPSHKETIENANNAGTNLTRLIKAYLEEN